METQNKTVMVLITRDENNNITVKRSSKDLVVVFGMMEFAKQILMGESRMPAIPPSEQDIIKMVKEAENHK